MGNPSINTIIGKDSSFKGTLTVKNSVEIKGHFEGAVNTEEDVYLRLGSQTKGDVKAGSVVLEGRLDGNIEATKMVVVRTNAFMQGDIHSPNLKIENKATTRGNVVIAEVKPPTK